MARFQGENLSCIRGGRVVFAGLSFDVGPGEALFLLGPNGSGKSSLLRVMAGLSRPETGVMRFDGDDTAEDPERFNRAFHYVGHLDGVKTALTLAENVHLSAGLRGARADAPAALARFGLDHLADMPARLLSAGQRRRLALTRLAAAQAPLWLLDEPSVALDKESVARLEGAIKAHRAGGGMVVVSTNVDLGVSDAAELQLPDFMPDMHLPDTHLEDWA